MPQLGFVSARFHRKKGIPAINFHLASALTWSFESEFPQHVLCPTVRVITTTSVHKHNRCLNAPLRWQDGMMGLKIFQDLWGPKIRQLNLWFWGKSRVLGCHRFLGQAESITLLWTISLCSSFAMDHGLRLVRLDQTRTVGFLQIRSPKWDVDPQWRAYYHILQKGGSTTK